MESTRANGPRTLRWTVFCRVVDNFGDVGVCWRLAAQLGARGDRVRLVIDDASALAWMAPAGAAGVEVTGWHDAAFDIDDPDDVVVEAFGCDPPPAFVAAMRAAPRVPVWINLEHLSAEAYVERSHGLPSPQLAGAAAGLTKWFFYPGFTARTGGLLREDGLLAERGRFDRAAWLAAQGISWQPGERVVTLFCYDNPACADLVPALGGSPASESTPALLLLTPGPAQRQVTTAPPGVRLHPLPWLTQPAFDRLLWSSDLAFVRGEDSLVRALWAGVPFVWQAYPQHDGAHHAKIEALLARLAPPAEVAALWRAWNAMAPWPAVSALHADTLAPHAAWARSAQRLRDDIASRPDLAAALRTFALERAT